MASSSFRYVLHGVGPLSLTLSQTQIKCFKEDYEDEKLETTLQQQSVLVYHHMCFVVVGSWLQLNLFQEGNFYIKPRSLHWFCHWVDEITPPPDLINIPSRYVPVDLSAIKIGFKSLCGFLNCCGAIDYMHFKVELPGNVFASDYYNKDRDYSIVIQAIVDNEAKRAQSGEILNGPAVSRSQYQFREYIIGDSGYYELPWLVIPFPSANGTELRETFNFYLSSSRMGFNCNTHISSLCSFMPLKALHGKLRSHLAALKNELVELINRDVNDFRRFSSCCLTALMWFPRLWIRSTTVVTTHGVDCWSELQDLPFIKTIEKRIQNANASLRENLEKCIKTGMERCDKKVLYHCLHAYVAIDDTARAEKAFHITIVAPFVSRIFPGNSFKDLVGGGAMDKLEEDYKQETLDLMCLIFLETPFLKNFFSLFLGKILISDPHSTAKLIGNT
ncbi:hypothetical protein SELMODRAFT_425553 [Selaginella moellendorffii]|uniref:Conserved oligomeric Golgi complex subunit 2 n=1 Tax=Selaginella moellendorffii TaxID=88036 RepID=D8STH1_SELML|nr:hypothetical protein SELMODRAFT_425553 [Selaginella moellendorffii]